MEKLIIKRSEWLRGESETSFLLRSSDGKKCCLGFYALFCGLQKKDIINLEAKRNVRNWPGDEEYLQACWLFDNNFRESQDCDRLIEINDDSFISEEKREKLISEIFASHDVEVEFID